MVNFCENFQGAQAAVFSICALQFINPSISMNPFKFSVKQTMSMKCHARTRRPVQLLVVLGLGLLVAACGGGGDSSAAPAAGTPATATPTVAEAETVVIQSGVLLHDGFSGFLRMLDLAGVTRLTGQAGQVSVACPGGGSVLTTKLSLPTVVDPSRVSTVFTLTANQCRFSSRDGLVYHGVWEVTTGTPSALMYSASGACATTCNGGQIYVRTTSAQYGYGVADNPAPGVSYDVLSSNNQHRFSGGYGNNLLPGPQEAPYFYVSSPYQSNTLPLQGGGVAFQGALLLISKVSPGAPSTISTFVSITDMRDTLKIVAPFKAALQVSDAGVTATVDSYGTTPAHTSTIPWSAFLD